MLSVQDGIPAARQVISTAVVRSPIVCCTIIMTEPQPPIKLKSAWAARPGASRTGAERPILRHYRSKFVTPRYPIVPIIYGFLGFLINVKWLQLCQ